MTESRSPASPVQPFATEAGAADAHLPPGPPPGPWRFLDRLVVAVFALALVVPGILLAAGRRGPQVENRPPRPLPALTMSGLANATWPAGVDGFITDHLFPRPYAIRLRGEVYWLLGATGNPEVVRGLDNWLFIRGEFEPTCLFTGAQLGAALEAAAAEFQAAGQEFRVLLVPDKHTVYPEKVRPDSPFGPTCQDTGRADIEASFARLGQHAIDARGIFAAARANPGAPDLYYSQDTHWAPSGAVAAIKALIQSIDPALWSDDDVVAQGTKLRVMDTARLMGVRHPARTPKLVVRPGVSLHREDVTVPVEVDNARAVFRITSTGDRPVLLGRTLVIYDSFFGIDVPLVAPFFADSTWVHVGDMVHHPELAEILGPFDRIVFERVERGFYATDVGSMLAPLVGTAPR